ncbi:MAG: hypothetical protein K2F83_04450 [Oscillospiraceae bacterium]|nr:hypothetical protein [Oscillospiraceae bacterium]
MASEKCGTPGYAGLVLLASLVSIEMAQEMTADQLELLSAFFEVLGDDLALLALSPGGSECCGTNQE